MSITFFIRHCKFFADNKYMVNNFSMLQKSPMVAATQRSGIISLG